MKQYRSAIIYVVWESGKKIFKKSKIQNNEKYQENEYQKLKHSRKYFSKFTTPYVPIDRVRFKDLGKFAHPHKKYHLVEK